MDKMISIITVCFSLLMVIYYSVKCFHSKVSFNSQVMVGLILKTSGAIVGGLLILSAILPQVQSYLAQEELYLLIAGLSVLAVSVQGIYNDFLDLKDNE